MGSFEKEIFYIMYNIRSNPFYYIFLNFISFGIKQLPVAYGALLIDGARHLLVSMHYHLIACWIIYTNWTIIKMRRQLDQLSKPESRLRSPHGCCSCYSHCGSSGGIIVTSEGDSQPDILSSMNDAITDVDEAIKLLSEKVPDAGGDGGAKVTACDQKPNSKCKCSQPSISSLVFKLLKKCGVGVLRLVLSLVLLACNYIEQAIIDSAIVVQSESNDLSTNQETVSSQYPSQLEIVEAKVIPQKSPEETIELKPKADHLSRRRSGQIGVAAHKSETVYEDHQKTDVESRADGGSRARSGQIGPKRHKTENEVEVENGEQTKSKKETKPKNETKPKKETKPKMEINSKKETKPKKDTKPKKNVKKEPKSDLPQIKILPPSSGQHQYNDLSATRWSQTDLGSKNGVMLLKNRLQKEKEALIQIRNRQMMFKHKNDQAVDQAVGKLDYVKSNIRGRLDQIRDIFEP